MSHRRHVMAVLGGFLLAAIWTAPSSAHTSSHPSPQHVVFDSTTYQSVQDLVSGAQVMVVAQVESVGTDHSTPAIQPTSLVTVRVTNVLRGVPAKHLVVLQPRGRSSQVGDVAQSPLKAGRTYLLLLDREPSGRSFFLVGGSAGEFSYDAKTKRFTKVDTAAAWENTDFTLSLAKAGAQVFSPPAEPSWLSNTGGPPGSPAVSWSSMANDLGMRNFTDVACPNENLCVFAGAIAPPSPGQLVPAVAVSTGPFTPRGNVVGTTTTFPSSTNSSQSYVACAGPSLCVLSTVDGIYVTTNPIAAQWSLEVAPSPAYSYGQVSCPTTSFCAVATGAGVLVSATPSSGSAWTYIHVGPLGQAISCPSPKLCVAGGYGDETVGGWIATSTNPLVAASWHGGPTPHPAFAQHSGQYGVTGISCPSTAFCVAAVSGGEPLISTDPAGGVSTWTEATKGSNDPGVVICATSGQCAVSGSGSFKTTSQAAGPGIVGYPLPGVTCVTRSFCVTVTDTQLAVGKVDS